MTELDLTRGAFLEPVLVRAVRAAGVQAGFDLARLGQVAAATATVARTWAAGDGPDPLRVQIEQAPGTLEVRVRAPRQRLAAAVTALRAPADGAPPPQVSLTGGDGADEAWLRLTFT